MSYFFILLFQSVSVMKSYKIEYENTSYTQLTLPNICWYFNSAKILVEKFDMLHAHLEVYNQIYTLKVFICT